jgi:hypothetical protein
MNNYRFWMPTLSVARACEEEIVSNIRSIGTANWVASETT